MAGVRPLFTRLLALPCGGGWRVCWAVGLLNLLLWPGLATAQGPQFPGNSPSAQAIDPDDLPPGGIRKEDLPTPDELLIPTPPPQLVAPQEMVLDVRIVGNQTVSLQRVKSKLTTIAGRPFKPIDLENDVRSLNSTRMFINVETNTQRTPQGVIVTFQVLEAPSLRYVKYLGNIKIKERHLAKKTELKKGDPFDPVAVEEGRRKIEEHYLEKGYSKASVQIMEGNKPGDRGAVFLIHEGHKQKIEKVVFVGNTITDGARLKTQIQSKPPILWLFKGEVNREQIDEDKQRLTVYYRSLGFFDAQIEPELIWDEDHRWLTLQFVINEGLRYKIRAVGLNGNVKYPTDRLTPDLKLKTGEYFDQSGMLADVNRLQDTYGEVGYVFADIKPETLFLDEPGQVDLVYNIEEGARWRIGRIEVQIDGADPHTKRNTVLNRLSLRPGQIANIRELRASERRLKASGLFLNEPQNGKTPSIVFQRPDANEMQFAEADPNMRGQSPDVYGPAPGDPGDRFIDLNVQGQWVARDQQKDEEPRSEAARWYSQPAQQDQGQAAPRAPRGQSRQQMPQAMPRQRVLVRGQSPGGYTPAQQPSGVQRADYQPTGGEYDAQHAVGQVPLGATDPYSAPSYRAGRIQDPNVVPAQHIDGLPLPNTDPRNRPSSLPPRGTAPPAYGPAVEQPTPHYAGQPGPLANDPSAGGGDPANPLGTPFDPEVDTGGTYDPFGPGVSEGSPTYGFNGQQEMFPSTGIPAIDNDPALPVDVNIRTDEAQTGRIMFGVGVNSDAGVVGQFVIDEQNFDWRKWPRGWEDIRKATAFRGDGQRLRLEAVPGTEVQRYSVNFTEPYFMDTRVSLGLSAFLYDRRFRDWDEGRFGGRVSLGYQFTPDLSITGALRAEQVDITDPRTPTPPELADALGEADLFGAKISMAHDTRDSSFLATEGHLVEVGFEQVFGSYDYPRLTAEARKHFMMKERPDRSGRHVLTVGTQIGITGTHTPIYDHFFAGGFSTLRGFDFRGASPRNLGVIVGGDFQFINSVEYMFPISADDMLRGVVFCDFGTVERDITIDADNFRVSPGAGLRITVPALGPAPIALDFSGPVMHADGDRIQNFAFFVGFGR